MNNLSALISEELELNPHLIELLQSGLANISALAAVLKKPLEAKSSRAIKSAAIGMGIRRYLTRTENKPLRVYRFPTPLEISTRSAIYEVAMPLNRNTEKLAEKIRKTFSVKQGDFFTIAQGSYEIVIFTNQHNKKTIRDLVGKTASEWNNLACVTVKWPAVTKDIPGIYYRVTRALALRSISIQSFDTIGTEMTIFVKGEVLGAAYTAITQLLGKKEIF